MNSIIIDGCARLSRNWRFIR